MSVLHPFLRGCFWPPRGGPFLWRKRLSPLRCPHACLKGEQNALFLFPREKNIILFDKEILFHEIHENDAFGNHYCAAWYWTDPAGE